MGAATQIVRREGAAAAAGPSADGEYPPSAASSASRASPMSRSRRPRVALEAAAQQPRTPGGVAAGSALQSGSRLSTAASTSLTVSPAKSRWPVSISKSTTPKAQMSARLSTALPRACSGDM